VRAPELALHHNTGEPTTKETNDNRRQRHFERHARPPLSLATPPSAGAAKLPSRTRSALAEHRAERGLFADGAAACGLLHVAWDAMQQVDSGRRHAGKCVTRHEMPPSR